MVAGGVSARPYRGRGSRTQAASRLQSHDHRIEAHRREPQPDSARRQCNELDGCCGLLGGAPEARRVAVRNRQGRDRPEEMPALEKQIRDAEAGERAAASIVGPDGVKRAAAEPMIAEKVDPVEIPSLL